MPPYPGAMLARISVRLEDATREALERLAAQEQRTLSQTTALALKEWLRWKATQKQKES